MQSYGRWVIRRCRGPLTGIKTCSDHLPCSFHLLLYILPHHHPLLPPPASRSSQGSISLCSFTLHSHHVVSVLSSPLPSSLFSLLFAEVANSCFNNQKSLNVLILKFILTLLTLVVLCFAADWLFLEGPYWTEHIQIEIHVQQLYTD